MQVKNAFTFTEYSGFDPEIAAFTFTVFGGFDDEFIGHPERLVHIGFVTGGVLIELGFVQELHVNGESIINRAVYLR